MTYLLDTNVAVTLLKDRPQAAVRVRFREVLSAGRSVAVSTVVVFELWFGVAKSPQPRENADRLRLFLSGGVDVAPLVHEDARLAGELRAALAKAGTPIGPYDLLIAGQALHREATLVTANVREFSRIPGLRWEDWTTPT